MIQTLAILYLLSWALDLNYPLVLMIDPSAEQVSSYGLASEYIGFIGIAILDFFVALGILYLLL